MKRMQSLVGWFRNRSLISKVLILGVLVGGLWLGGTKLFGTAKTATQYQTTAVERGTLITSVTASGTVSSGNNSSISTSASGVVTKLYVQNGDTVTKGEKIADISLDASSDRQQASAYASYLSAQNALNSAKAKMNSLQSALFKANQAFVLDKGVANPSDTDKSDPKYIEERADWLQAESDYNNQAGVIAQAEAAYTSAYLSYQQYAPTIVAPADGVVSNLTISEGAAITNSSSSDSSSSSSSNTSTSQTIGTVAAEQSQLQTKVNVSEIDVTSVEVGQKATLTLDAFPDKTFAGKVVAIDTNGSVSSGVTTYPVTIVFDSAAGHIYPNMAVSAVIITKVKNDVLLVPSAAVQTSNGDTSVRVMKNGQPQQVSVTVGDASDTQTEITAGVNEGDTVVTNSISTSATGTSTTASPFGNSGFGVFRTVGGVGGARRAN